MAISRMFESDLPDALAVEDCIQGLWQSAWAVSAKTNPVDELAASS